MGENMKERPILFTGPSIPAVMDGTKSQTRRLINMNKLSVDVPDTVTKLGRFLRPGRYRVRMSERGDVYPVGLDFALRPGEFHFRCPLVDGRTILGDGGWVIIPEGAQRLWVKDSRFMSKVTSQMSVAATQVRIQRLGDITDDDAVAEGIVDGHWLVSPTNAFAARWNKLHGKGAWSLNPWVWAYTFRRC